MKNSKTKTSQEDAEEIPVLEAETSIPYQGADTDDGIIISGLASDDITFALDDDSEFIETTNDVSKGKSIRKVKHKIINAKSTDGYTILQPIWTALMTHDFSLPEYKIFYSVLDKLRFAFIESTALYAKSKSNNVEYDVKQLSIFKDDAYNDDANKDNLVIHMNFKDFNVARQHYDELEAALRKIQGVTVTYNKEKADGQRWEVSAVLFPQIEILRRSNCDSDVKEFKNNINVLINKETAYKLFNCSGWTNILQRLIIDSKSKYTIRFYGFCSSFASKGEFKFKYTTLREKMQLDDYLDPKTKRPRKNKNGKEMKPKYPDFRKFRTAIIQTAYSELKDKASRGDVDYFFEYNVQDPTGQVIYSSTDEKRQRLVKGKSEAYLIHFFVKNASELLNKEKFIESLPEKKEKIWDFLKKSFMHGVSEDLRAYFKEQIFELITADNYNSFVSEVYRLEAYVNDAKNKVNSKHTYVLKSLLNKFSKPE